MYAAGINSKMMGHYMPALVRNELIMAVGSRYKTTEKGRQLIACYNTIVSLLA